MSRKRLENVEQNLWRNEGLKIDYEKIIQEQLEEGIVEKAPEQSKSPHVFYMPYKPVVREDATVEREEATTTKVQTKWQAKKMAWFSMPVLSPILLPIVSMSVCTLARPCNLCYGTS